MSAQNPLIRRGIVAAIFKKRGRGGVILRVVVTAILFGSCLGGCAASTRHASQRAWAELKSNAKIASKGTGGMIVNLSELLHLSIKSAFDWSSRVQANPATHEPTAPCQSQAALTATRQRRPRYQKVVTGF